jgi:hypothetical protein
MPRDVMQLTRSGAVPSGTDDDVERLREQFDRRHFFRLRELIEPDFCAHLLRRIEEAEFAPRTHGEIGTELWVPDPGLTGALDFLMNDPNMLSLVENVTGCGHIGTFNGRIYRFAPGAGHYDSWHSDLGGGRLVAMSVNLSSEPYSGGVLQIREQESGNVLEEVANPGVGDAVLFRLSEHLQHRVTDVEGTAPRTAFAGWFQSQPEYRAMLDEMRAGAAGRE